MSVYRISRTVLRRISFTSFRVGPAAAQTLSHRQTVNENVPRRNFSVFSKSPDYSEVPLMDLVTFEAKSSEALEALTDYFDELVESDSSLAKADVAYSDGVLTVKLGGSLGTYVINRQTPNRQLWLSSPTSGPKRYDFVDDSWIYKHDGVSLHQLLQDELSKALSVNVNFLDLASRK